MNKDTFFSLYKDFRVQGRTTHKMEHFIYITIAAVLSGMESWYEIEMFGKEKSSEIRGKVTSFICRTHVPQLKDACPTAEGCTSHI